MTSKLLLLCIITLAVLLHRSNSQDGPTFANCRDALVATHGQAIIFLRQLRPLTIRILKYLAVDICPETKGNFFLQVWRNETTDQAPTFKLIWQWYVQRSSPRQSLFTIPVLQQLNLTGLSQSHMNRLFFGISVPITQENPEGMIPVRRYFVRDHYSLTSRPSGNSGRYNLGENREFSELFWPYFFMISVCSGDDVNDCELPAPPEQVVEDCGIPAKMVSNVTEVPLRGKVKAIMVDFCALNVSVEMVLVKPVGSNTTDLYRPIWGTVVMQSGPLRVPTIVNVTNGPSIDGADYHIVVRRTAGPPSGGQQPFIPVRVVFDPVTPHTRIHSDDDVPTTFRDALRYPYFLPVSFCKDFGCPSPRERWAREALGLPPLASNLTTPIPVTISTTPTDVTIIELPPLPGPVGPYGDPGPPGPRGPKGDLGIMGPEGPFGRPGLFGPQGPQGQKGQLGFQGLPGTPNLTPAASGPRGEKGPSGEKGDSGEEGMRGEKGITPLIDNTRAAASASGRKKECNCSGLVSRMLILGLLVWAALLTFLLIVLVVVAKRKVASANAPSEDLNTTRSWVGSRVDSIYL